MLNLRAFKARADSLAPEKLADYVRTIAGRTEDILRGLCMPDALATNDTKLADAAHALAGSAIMFGFERLAAAALGFERAVQTGAVETPAFADDLRAAATITLEEIHTRNADRAEA